MKSNIYQATISRPHMMGRNRIIADLLHEIITVMEREGSLAPSIEAGERYVVSLELDEQQSMRRGDWTESRLRMELTKVQEQTYFEPPADPVFKFDPPQNVSRWKRLKQFIKGE